MVRIFFVRWFVYKERFWVKMFLYKERFYGVFFFIRKNSIKITVVL